MMDRRPATYQEILNYYGGRRTQFETYAREVSDHRTEHGVRHIRRATAMVHDVNGVPVVRRHGHEFELFATFFTPDIGRPFIACPTIIKR